MIMIPNGLDKTNNYVEFINDLKALVAEGKVPPARIDDAVRADFADQISDGPVCRHSCTDPGADRRQWVRPNTAQVARQCVRESLVLLKNEKHALPLAKNLKHLVVVGAGADDLGMQCGGWTVDWQGGHGDITHGGTTLLAAIRQTVSPDTQVTFSPDASNLAQPTPSSW